MHCERPRKALKERPLWLYGFTAAPGNPSQITLVNYTGIEPYCRYSESTRSSRICQHRYS